MDGGALAPSTITAKGRDFEAQRGAAFLGASLGLTVRAGPFTVRPRMDAVLVAGRQTEESWDLTHDFESGASRETTLVIGTTVRPRVLLLGVDIGWSFGE